LLVLGCTSAGELSSFADLIHLVPSGRAEEFKGNALDEGETLSGVVMADSEYTANYHMKNYNSSQFPIEALGASISAWLLDNDPQRKGPYEVIINVDIEDEDTGLADLQFEVVFDDQIVIEQSTHGNITYKGTLWSIKK
jgi:hypothetical protein